MRLDPRRRRRVEQLAIAEVGDQLVHGPRDRLLQVDAEALQPLSRCRTHPESGVRQRQCESIRAAIRQRQGRSRVAAAEHLDCAGRDVK